MTARAKPFTFDVRGAGAWWGIDFDFEGEEATAISLSESFVTVTTSGSYVRVYTLFGVPYRVYRPKSAPTVTCASWRDYVLTVGNGPVGGDGRARLSNLMGIHKALRIIFSEPQRGYAWLRTGNTAFAGASALDVMLGGELTDIMRVRRYLDAERGGW